MKREIVERYSKLPLGNICDANDKKGSMDHLMRSVNPLDRCVGFAFTVKGHPGDNLAIHRAILEAPEGSVLVVDINDYCKGGHFGEVMGTACQNKGIVGLVINGTVRDADNLAEIGFPVFARGTYSGGTTKNEIGILGQPIVCGGVIVNTGDLIAADRDGVVVVEEEEINEVLEKAEAIFNKELNIVQELKNGKTTVEIYKFPKLIK